MATILPFPARATVRLSPRRLARKPKAQIVSLPQPSPDDLHRAACDIDETEPNRALIMYQNAMASGPHYLSMVNVGIIHFRAGREAEAIDWLERAWRVDPSMPEAPYNRGYIALEAAARLPVKAERHAALRLAIEWIRRSLDVDGGQSHLTADSWFNLGEAQFGLGEFEAAIAAHRQHIRLAPFGKWARRSAEKIAQAERMLWGMPRTGESGR
jgi:tetratricopeptide (TPR) repeat protein